MQRGEMAVGVLHRPAHHWLKLAAEVWISVVLALVAIAAPILGPAIPDRAISKPHAHDRAQLAAVALWSA
jgi:hypothetical protein